MISSLSGMATETQTMLKQLEKLCMMTKNNINLLEIISNEKILCQFILDPSSLNLSKRVSLSDPVINMFYKFSREYCYLIDKTRIELLKQLTNNKI